VDVCGAYLNFLCLHE
jgi:hypothetical protein